jgi:hypothetical protein
MERGVVLLKEREKKEGERRYIEIHVVIPLPLYERAREIAKLLKNGDRRRWTYIVDEAIRYVLSSPATDDLDLVRSHLMKPVNNPKDVHLKIDPLLWNELLKRFNYLLYPSLHGVSRLITYILRKYLSSVDEDELKRQKERKKKNIKEENTEKKFIAVLSALRNMGLTIYTGSQVGEPVFNEALQSIGIDTVFKRSFWKRRFEKYGFIEIQRGFRGKREITIMKTFDTQADGDCPLYSYRDPVQRIIYTICDILGSKKLPYSMPRLLFEEALHKCGFYASSTVRKYIRMMRGRGLIKYANRREVVFGLFA